jgi:hypothetical protein
LICPEGYFTPRWLESKFVGALSSDRIAPRIYEVANCNFNSIAPKARPSVLSATAKVFIYQYVSDSQNSLQVYCPTRNSPLKIDAWLLRSALELPCNLPETEAQAKNTLLSLAATFPLVCETSWTVKNDNSALVGSLENSRERACVEKLDGWSICFSEKLQPADYGSLLEAMARDMVRRNGTTKRQQKKRGPKGKIGLVAEAIAKLYPERVPDKTAKEIQRDLHKAGVTDFKDATLRKAMKLAKDKSLSAS